MSHFIKESCSFHIPKKAKEISQGKEKNIGVVSRSVL
jgi:hypothetical protein